MSVEREPLVVWRRELLRDWLRDNPADRELYAASGAAVEVEILERAWAAVVDEPAEVEFVTEDPPHNAPITLEEYDPRWPRWYAVEEAKIRAALGPVAVRVEHCGSTSVPGLAAKPLIDVVLVVPDSDDEDAYVPALVRAGYYLRVREPGWFGHRLLKGTVPNVNMHVFSPGCVEVDRMLAFRDRLRSHDEDREEYERVKRELAVRTWERVQDYADAKTQVVRRITLRALA
ncbi:GrpB family protein [Lentzea sp. NPDC055074]